MSAIDITLLENLVGYHLKKAYFALVGEMESQLGKLGMAPPEFAILSLVASNPGVTQSKLNAHLYISRSWCSELIEQLLDKKLIQRDPINLKSFGLYITPKGERHLKKSRAVVDDFESRFRHQLTDQEIQQLITLLGKISAPAVTSKSL